MAETALTGDDVAVLGRDIRTAPERIAAYCVTRHAPIYEDVATLVESMAYWDRRIPRHRATGWARQLQIEVPVYERSCFARPDNQAALADAAWFLTGDQWSFNFIARRGPVPDRQEHLGLPKAPIAHIVPFSDGLDSFAQAKLSAHCHGRDGVILVRSGLGRERSFQDLITLRIPRRFSGSRMRETSYRTRPLVFYTMAAIGAAITGAGAVVIGENGQGSIGPACLPFADEWWFRSAHPGFIARWSAFLALVMGSSVRFEQPQLWRTKGEVLSELAAGGLTAGWELTSSCATRPNGRHGRRACGVCGGCLLRAVASHSAGLSPSEGDYAFDLRAAQAVAHGRSGEALPMSAGERAVAVRAIAAMVDFARLLDSPGRETVVTREARLVDPKAPSVAGQSLVRLLGQHTREWDQFLDHLPNQSWVLEIVSQL
ncbi:MAG TPA: 7-cyano-7-deazaguanine synthase [Caulobacteraceae bacterium]